jgi:CheY-like chemotaxis protein
VLQVTDTGIGIASDQLGFIFDRFHQVDQGVEFESGSTGLGLSIVSELAEIHGGRATVVSEVGKGSTFEVELLVHLANNEVLAKSSSEIGSSSEFKGVRVLVAEDNPFNARYATRLMQRWGADYEVVENGKLAFELFKRNRWDVVLMDVQMPACDGLESTRLIRSFEASQATSGKQQKAAIIIGLSAFDLEHDIIAAMDAGMNTHIRKPYTPGDLSKVMRQSLKGLPPAPMPKTKTKSKKRREDHPVYTMCEGDEALWLEFVEVFKKGWPKIRQEIQAALDAGDASMQHLSLHKVKPSLAMVDLQQAYKRSIDLESRAKAGENLPPDEVALMVDEVDVWADE